MSALDTVKPSAEKSFDFRYLCVLDFEATCERDVKIDQEIIQFPSVLLKVDEVVGSTATSTVPKLRTSIVSEVDMFIKPASGSKLTAFCTELTGITQEQVDAGISIAEAITRHSDWLCAQTGIRPAGKDRPPIDDDRELQKTVLVVTCGDWDLKTMLPTECSRLGMAVPLYFTQWLNIKTGYEEHTKRRTRGMAAMLSGLRLSLKGRHHNGLDDCRNIGRITSTLISQGFIPHVTRTLSSTGITGW